MEKFLDSMVIVARGVSRNVRMFPLTVLFTFTMVIIINCILGLIKVYQEGLIINECPLFIAYDNENAIDEGGVSRDMFSAFWEKAYSTLFDSAALLVPFILPTTDVSIFPILGKIISHGYLASGSLPVRICLTSLLPMLLGSGINIPRSYMLDALLDYVSQREREKLMLVCVSRSNFQPK